jgi:hypothetical protein
MLPASNYRSEPIRTVIDGREDVPVPRTIVSAILAVRNEERHIESALKSLFCSRMRLLLIWNSSLWTVTLTVKGCKPDWWLDALSAAGSTTPRAGKSVTITHRDHPEAAETIMLSNSDGRTMTNVSVLPGAIPLSFRRPALRSWRCQGAHRDHYGQPSFHSLTGYRDGSWDELHS